MILFWRRTRRTCRKLSDHTNGHGREFRAKPRCILCPCGVTKSALTFNLLDSHAAASFTDTAAVRRSNILLHHPSNLGLNAHMQMEMPCRSQSYIWTSILVSEEVCRSGTHTTMGRQTSRATCFKNATCPGGQHIIQKRMAIVCQPNGLR